MDSLCGWLGIMITLEELVEKSTFILREVKAQFKNPAVLWSTGKDSTTMLSLIKETFFGEMPWPVVHLDTGVKFPEIYEFRDKVASMWGFRLIVSKNENAFSNDDLRYPSNTRFDCCTLMKTENLKQLIKRDKYDAVVVSIRRDEHGIRGKERYFSPRDADFKWRIYTKIKGTLKALQELELSGWGIYASDFGKVNHVRVHPILHWNEIDCWRYILKMKLPVNPLYFAKDGYRYRSLGCMPCTLPVRSNARTVEEIVEELKVTKEAERSGRAQDKEHMYTMQHLRALGYM